MGVFSILLGVLVEVFSSIVGVQLESESNSTIEQDGRYITARFIHDVNNAESMTMPVNPGDQSSTLSLVENGVTYTYILNGGNLSLTDNVDTNTLNSYDTTVSSLTFKRLGNTGGENTVTMQLTLTSNITQKSGSKDTKTLAITAGIRK